MKVKTTLIIFVVALDILICGAANHSEAGQAGGAAREPWVRLQSIDGKNFDLTEMRGSVVLISFGATWCVPCSGEISALEELTKEYQGKPVKFFWVSIESGAQISDSGLKRYAKDHKVTFTVLRDPTKTTYLQFSQRVRLPMTIFFDKAGHLDEQPQFGMSSEPERYKTRVRETLDKLLDSTRSEGGSN